MAGDTSFSRSRCIPNSHASPTWLMTGQAQFNASTSKGASPPPPDSRFPQDPLRPPRRWPRSRDRPASAPNCVTWCPNAQPVRRAASRYFASTRARTMRTSATVRAIGLMTFGNRAGWREIDPAAGSRHARADSNQPGMRCGPPGRSAAVGPDRDRPEPGSDKRLTAPPLEPPGVSARFHGLRVTPNTGLSV